MATSTPTTTTTPMKYRFLGGSGLLVSQLAIGGWRVFDGDDGQDKAYEMLVHGFRHGINFWDTAEGYGLGQSERHLGVAFERGVREKIWTREDLVISTKIFFGTTKGPNTMGTSRKHIIEGTRASLRRLRLDYVDAVFCHRWEPNMSIEEIVRAMNWVISQGWAFYWGTSEWTSADILEACEVADRLGLIRPIVEQPQYNLLERSKVEMDYVNLYKKYKTGLTTWSPLAFGVLTGKYANGIPPNSRFEDKYIIGLAPDYQERVAKAERVRPIAEELGCSMAQLAIAWCVSNERVSTVILGCSSLKQLDENLEALAFVDQITPEMKARIDALLPLQYKPPTPDRFCLMRQHYLDPRQQR